MQLMSMLTRTAMTRLAILFCVAVTLTTNANSTQSNCNEDAPIFKIGDHRFSIPMSYIKGLKPERAVANKRCGGTRETIGIDTLLPDFRPVPANAPEHKGGGPGRVVAVLVTMRPAGTAIGQMFWRAKYGRAEIESSAIGDQIGLKHYADSHPNGRDLFVDFDQGVARVYLSCDRDVGQMKYPFCNMYMNYAEDIYLDVSFGRSHIPEWKSIQSGVSGLIRSFEDKKSGKNLGEYR